MQEIDSIIEDLQAALQVYSHVLQETSSLKDLNDPERLLPCTETAAHLGQNSELVFRLSQYQQCAEQLRSLCRDSSTLSRVIALNQDLLQHLGFTGCPSPSPPPASDFDSVRRSIRCVDCWSQQVAALRR